LRKQRRCQTAQAGGEQLATGWLLDSHSVRIVRNPGWIAQLCHSRAVAQAVKPAEPRFISASGVWTFFC